VSGYDVYTGEWEWVLSEYVNFAPCDDKEGGGGVVKHLSEKRRGVRKLGKGILGWCGVFWVVNRVKGTGTQQ